MLNQIEITAVEIRKVDDMPSSRPSRYCLGLQNDSVFADFDLDEDGHIFLLRISFDGYGCCQTAEFGRTMSSRDSNDFVSLIESDRVNTPEMRSILSAFFKENIDVIWKDALLEHELLSA
jgi:hypothetical protein